MNKFIFSALILIFFVTDAQSQISWNNTIDVSPNTFGNLHPRIAIDGNNNPMILWGQSSTKVWFSKLSGAAFITPVQLNPSTIPAFSISWAGSDIASHGDTVYAVFKENPEATGHVYIVHSYDGGINFSAPVQVDNIADSISSFPTIATNDDGNPIVGFMKCNSGYTDFRWVVSKSADFGNTFSADVKASGFSGGENCECCPGTIVCDGSTVAMLYRDNLNNIRDTWAGISTDGANTFAGGINIDQNNWMLMSCPSTGPDGIIIDDTLYSVFMSTPAANDLIYWSKASISNLQSAGAMELTGMFTGLTQQNYPRMASHYNAAAIVWKQVVSSKSQLAIYFTSDIHSGFNNPFDTIAAGPLNEIVNADVVMLNGKIHVAWQDNASGTVKYKSGTYSYAENIKPVSEKLLLNVYPNPSSTVLTIEIPSSLQSLYAYEIYDINGKWIKTVWRNSFKQQIDISDLADGIYLLQPWACYWKPEPQKFIIHHYK